MRHEDTHLKASILQVLPALNMGGVERGTLEIGRALVAAPHLPFPGVVQIIDDSAGYRWLPIEYVNRAASPPALNPQYAQRR